MSDWIHALPLGWIALVGGQRREMVRVDLRGGMQAPHSDALKNGARNANGALADRATRSAVAIVLRFVCVAARVAEKLCG